MHFKNLKSISRWLLVVTLFTTIIISGLLIESTTAQEELDDADITTAIESELWFDDVVDANTIDVKTSDGIVTFTGTSNNILVKDRVAEITESIKGVRAIVNRISVKPLVARSDGDIQNAVSQALLRDPATDSYEIRVKVDKGVVSLTGKVESWAEKQLCATVAKGVKGVRDVENNISINLKTERADYEIKQDVEGRLTNDVQVDDYLIDVAVEDGKVSLSGTVGSLNEKNRATADAWVSGVKSVNSDDLKIEWWARDRFHRKKYYLSRTDEEIEEAVKDALFYDPRVLSFNPEIDVNLGIVTLNGVVDNLKAKKAAEQDARNTVGVWGVKNHLKVRPNKIPANDVLEKRVNKALLNDPYVERYDVHVDAKNGLIYLSGDVNTSFEKYQAERVAEGVNGVTLVNNNINYEYQWIWKPDREIKNDVIDQLTWSIFVDEKDVHVTVDDGIVTLTGEVNNWSEFNTAEKNAYEAGAKDVINNLTVTHRYYGPHYPYNYWRYPYYPFNW